MAVRLFLPERGCSTVLTFRGLSRTSHGSVLGFGSPVENTTTVPDVQKIAGPGEKQVS